MKWTRLAIQPNQKIDDENYNWNLWRIEDGYVWYKEKKLKNADINTFEVFPDYNSLLAKDKKHVYYASSKMTKIDAATFKYIGDGYFKDKNSSFCCYETSIKPLKGNDSRGFHLIGSGYAYDSKFAYYWGRPMKTCTIPSSLSLIAKDSIYAKDDENIYFDGARLKNAILQTWEEIGYGFSKDSKNVFFCSKKLPSAKVDSWQKTSHPYSMDIKNVYFMHIKIKGALPQSWERLNQNYSRDASSIYYSGRRLENVDIMSFEVISDDEARDKFGLIERDQHTKPPS